MRTYEAGIWSLGQNRDEFEGMSVRITKIDLCRWHPPDHARLDRGFSSEASRFNSMFAQLRDRELQLLKGNCKREVTSYERPVLSTVASTWTPQPHHSFLFLINPQEHDVPRGVAVCERQADDVTVKSFRDLCVCDRNVCLV